MRLLAAVLAAGAGRRFGGDKLHAPLAGRPVLAWTLRGVLEAADLWSLGVVVVTAPGEEAGAWDPPEAPVPVRRVQNPHAAEGMASSVRVAARCAAEAGAEGLLLCLGDMPAVDGRVLRALTAAWRPGTIVVACGPHGPTPPALFPAADFDALQRLSGDRGARAIWEAAGDRARRLAIPGEWWRDVDRPEDLAALERLLAY
ncbi:MAG: nucleotidyltransferase family protein [Firmicutes bacterium]|nr:nucleotidyltransferase family protein [Bacillota bacterium]